MTETLQRPTPWCGLLGLALAVSAILVSAGLLSGTLPNPSNFDPAPIEQTTTQKVLSLFGRDQPEPEMTADPVPLVNGDMVVRIYIWAPIILGALGILVAGLAPFRGERWSLAGFAIYIGISAITLHFYTLVAIAMIAILILILIAQTGFGFLPFG